VKRAESQSGGKGEKIHGGKSLGISVVMECCTFSLMVLSDLFIMNLIQ